MILIIFYREEVALFLLPILTFSQKTDVPVKAAPFFRLGAADGYFRYSIKKEGRCSQHPSQYH